MELPGKPARIGLERAALRALPTLAEYTDRELDTLIGGAQGWRFPAGWLICVEGKPGGSCFLLVSGEVEVVKQMGTSQRTLTTLRAGTIAGQMALVDGAPRSATLRAASETVAVELTREVFTALLKARSPLALRFQEQIAVAGVRQLRQATARLALLFDPERRAEREATRPARLVELQAAASEWSLRLDEPLEEVEVVALDASASRQRPRRP